MALTRALRSTWSNLTRSSSSIPFSQVTRASSTFTQFIPFNNTNSSSRHQYSLPVLSPSVLPSSLTLSQPRSFFASNSITAPSSQDSELMTPKSTALETGYLDSYFDHPHLKTPGDPSKRAFTYLVLGSVKFLAASAARVIILKLIYTMSASADVLAKGSVEVNLTSIPLGQSATVKWRGKPVFIRHRTSHDIELAEKDDNADLRDPQTDSERCEKKEWLIIMGVCTHLGCVPIPNAGDYHGWFCPCHGSHYDMSGRIRKGPAPLNLEVPPYVFIDNGNKLILG